jgi:hypothetical protein
MSFVGSGTGTQTLMRKSYDNPLMTTMEETQFTTFLPTRCNPSRKSSLRFVRSPENEDAIKQVKQQKLSNKLRNIVHSWN